MMTWLAKIRVPHPRAAWAGLFFGGSSRLQATEKRSFKTWALALGLFLALTTATNAQKFNGARAMDLTRQYVNASGPRWLGSPGHAKAEAFIKKFFAPEIAKGQFEEDTFTASTPAGYLPGKNFIVKYPGKKDGIIVLASHYETNYPLRNINFVGANDGGATSALLMEMANYLRAHAPEGYSVWLLFDDAEEAVGDHWDTQRDALYGTKHIAAKWAANGTLPKIKAFLLADMCADKDLNINKESNSTPWLQEMLKQAAKNTGHSAYIYKQESAVEDDHLPFKQRGVPVLDIIDINYGPSSFSHPDGYHHTADDTLDKISAASLQISGDLFVEMIKLINASH